jgi:hypothetical protein
MLLVRGLTALLVGLLRETAYLVAVWAVAVAIVWLVVFGVVQLINWAEP